MNIIKLLKDNWVPFGAWPEFYGKELGEKMQEKAREIGAVGQFRRFNGNGFGGIILLPDYDLEPDATHVLFRRPK